MKLKIIPIIFLTFLLLEFLSAIRINEIEINPEEGKQGTEWIEIYNDENEDEDISGWEIYDGLASEKKRYTFPAETIIDAGDFFIVKFSGAVLNNGGDFIIIKDDKGKEIDKTDELKESSSSSETWQFWKKEWIFAEETQDKKNDCEEDEEPENILDEENKREEETEKTTESKPLEPIRLNTQIIKSQDDKKNLGKNNYVTYGLIAFCILLAFLFIIRKKRYKNEFG